ncbi:MAG: anti-sigma factor, partial [Acidimicrobiia bacterium]
MSPPPGLKAAVMAEIGEQRVASVVDVGSRRRNRMAWLVASAAAVIAMVFIGLWAVTSNELGQAEQIAAVYESPDAQMVELDSSLGPVRFVFSPALGRGVLNGGSLSDLDDADLYEIWLIGDGAPVPSGTPVAGETAVLVEDVEPGLVLAVTVEPVPGSDAPTS